MLLEPRPCSRYQPIHNQEFIQSAPQPTEGFALDWFFQRSRPAAEQSFSHREAAQDPSAE